MSDFTNWLAQLSDALALQRTPECVRPIQAQIGVQHPYDRAIPSLELLNGNKLLGAGISSGWRADNRNHDLDLYRT